MKYSDPLKRTARLESADRLDIHNISSDIESCLKTLEKELSPENWKLVQKYNILLTASTISKAARRKELRTILSLNRLNENKPWESMTKNDVDALVAKVIDKFSPDGQETWYTQGHKRQLKIFLRWVKFGSREESEVENPPETKGIRIKPVKETLTRESLINDKERASMIAACDDLQSKALIDILDDAGGRTGEILTVRLKHVQFDKYGAILKVDGKTTARPIRLVRSARNLFNWYNNHPLKDNPDAPLFIAIRKGYFGNRMAYSTARNTIITAAKKAGVNKRVFFTLFRHTEATRSANFLTEAQMRKRHGWSKTSPMPSRYAHLVNADVENAVLGHHGLKQEDPTPGIKKCPFCDSINSMDVKNCENCGRALDTKTAIEQDENRDAEIKKIVEDKVLEILSRDIDNRILRTKVERLEKEEEPKS